MSRVLVVHGKHGLQIRDANDINTAALKLLRERVDTNWYYDEDPDGEPWLSRAFRILEASVDHPDKAGAAAWSFLRRRSDHDYEYEIVELLEVVE